MPNRVQRLRIHPPQSCQLVGIDAIALPLATLRPFHQPRVGHQHLVSPLGDHVLHPSRVSSYFDHYPRHGQCLEQLPYIFLRCPQLSFGQRFSLQTKNAVLTPAVSQIHSHRQPISIGANGVSPAIFFCARRHRRRIQFSRQLPQDFREYLFRISLHRTSRFRPLQGWFTPLQRLAMLLQGRSPFSWDGTLSALITASLTPSVIGDRPSHPIWLRQQSVAADSPWPIMLGYGRPTSQRRSILRLHPSDGLRYGSGRTKRHRKRHRMRGSIRWSSDVLAKTGCWPLLNFGPVWMGVSPTSGSRFVCWR